MKTCAMILAAAVLFAGPAFAGGDYLNPTKQEAEGTLTIAAIAITAKHFCSAEIPNAVVYHPKFLAFTDAAFAKFKADGLDAGKFAENKHGIYVYVAKNDSAIYCKLHMPALADLLTALNGASN